MDSNKDIELDPCLPESANLEVSVSQLREEKNQVEYAVKKHYYVPPLLGCPSDLRVIPTTGGYAFAIDNRYIILKNLTGSMVPKYPSHGYGGLRLLVMMKVLVKI